jgi:ABC-type branched-subunit amino acid transport system permease subunit
VVVVGAGTVVAVVVGAAVVVVGWATGEDLSSRSAEPATEMPDTTSAAITNETRTGGRKTCLRAFSS